MELSPKKMAALKSMGKTLAATVVASAIGLAASPEAINVVGKDKAFLLTLVLIPALDFVRKHYFLGRAERDGAGDAGDAA